MKTFLLAIALLGTELLGTGLCGQPPRAPRIMAAPHRSFPRARLRPPNYNWNHGYWKVHRYGYWNHHRGYWTVRHGRHIFISRD